MSLRKMKQKTTLNALVFPLYYLLFFPVNGSALLSFAFNIDIILPSPYKGYESKLMTTN